MHRTATVTCPGCLRPVSLRVQVHVMSDGEVIVERADAQRGIAIHVRKGCVARK